MAVVPDVEVLVIPEHLGDGGLLLARRPAVEMKVPHRSRLLPGRLIEFGVDGDGGGGAMDLISGERLRGGNCRQTADGQKSKVHTWVCYHGGQEMRRKRKYNAHFL